MRYHSPFMMKSDKSPPFSDSRTRSSYQGQSLIKTSFLYNLNIGVTVLAYNYGNLISKNFTGGRGENKSVRSCIEGCIIYIYIYTYVYRHIKYVYIVYKYEAHLDIIYMHILPNETCNFMDKMEKQRLFFLCISYFFFSFLFFFLSFVPFPLSHFSHLR